MSNPFPGIKVKIETKEYGVKITDIQTNSIELYTNTKNVTNYEYEVQKNEEKRKILILKPEYLSVFLSDMRNIMKYGKSSQYINDKTKRVYNPKLKGV